MKTTIYLIFLSSLFVGCRKRSSIEESNTQTKYLTIPKLAVANNQITSEWIDALRTRQSAKFIEELSQNTRPLSASEYAWYELIKFQSLGWNSIKDSLRVPFEGIAISDTTNVLLGYQGHDDAFTFEHQTVCFDLSALAKSYGHATDSINANRIDRIFAHEYTHLLHKAWARQSKLKLNNFKDSIMWHCLYEGIGMYRSMSSKWFPVNGQLSPRSKETFEVLYPIFADKFVDLLTIDTLTNEEKSALEQNLSRGSMTQKWGALPVGVWLALEANGDDRNLIPIIEKGPYAILELADKYLTGDSHYRFKVAMK